MNNNKTKLLVPRDQVKDIEGLERIARAIQQATLELKQANDLHCNDCDRSMLYCICPSGRQQPEICPEPWMKRP
jgi:hypothetical protein